MEVPLKDVSEVIEFKLPRAYVGSSGTRSKRLLDITGALLAAVLALPLGLLIVILIKLDSRGAVLFTQPRMGRHGRCFKMVKFRTMHLNAEAHLDAILHANPALKEEYETYHKLQQDPRVTRIGRLLRKYSLDELPQLWNILKGDMSLVGPRPYLPEERPRMNGAEREILNVTPGLTGFWQVYARNGVCFQERVHMDIYYIRIRSIWMDVLLLFRTIGVVLNGKDAS